LRPYNVVQTNVYVLGAVFLQLCRLLRLEQHPLISKPIDPSLFIHRFADKLNLGRRMHAVAGTALRLVAGLGTLDPRLKPAFLSVKRHPMTWQA